MAAVGLATSAAVSTPSEARIDHLETLWKELVTASAQLTACPATQDELAADAFWSLAGKSPEYAKRCLKKTVRNKHIDRLRKYSREVSIDELIEGETFSSDPVLGGESRDFEELVAAAYRESLEPQEISVLDLLEQGLSERKIARELRRPRYQIRQIRDALAQKARKHFEVIET